MDQFDTLNKEIKESNLDEISGEITKELAKAVPIVKILYKISTATANIRNKINAKKIIHLIQYFKDVAPSERQDFLGKLVNNDKYHMNASEQVWLILDSFIEKEKVAVFGSLLKAGMKLEIDFSDFQRFTHVIQRAYYQDLTKLRDIVMTNGKIDDQLAFNLQGTGLIKSEYHSQEILMAKAGKWKHSVTELGQKFVKYAF